MARRPQLVRPTWGEVYLVAFDPSIGAEIQKTRPALIVQNDVANRHSPITIVAAIRSQFDEPLYPSEVCIQPPEGGLTIPSVVLLNQCVPWTNAGSAYSRRRPWRGRIGRF
jgi:mRNA interferase MazF